LIPSKTLLYFYAVLLAGVIDVIAHIIAHADEDGISSSVMMSNYLRRIGYSSVLITFLKRVFENDFKKAAMTNSDLVVLLDLGATYGDYINRYLKEKRVWVIDHHKRYGSTEPDVELYLNPTENGEPDYTTSTSYLVYTLVKKEGMAAPNDPIIATIGMIGDMVHIIPGKNLNFERVLGDAAKIEYASLKKGWISGGKEKRRMWDAVIENFVPAPNVEELRKKKYLLVQKWSGAKDQFELLEEIYPKEERAVRKTIYLKGVEIHDVVRWVRDVKSPLEKEYRMRMVYENYIPFRPDFAPYTLVGTSVQKNVVETDNFYFYVKNTFDNMVIELNYLSSWYYRDKPVFAINRSGSQVYVHGRLSRMSGNTCDIGKVLNELGQVFGGDGGGHTFAGTARLPGASIETARTQLEKLCREYS